ncbi:hypothetical protein [Paraburkholderia sp. Ac-20347]|uniref:hypothetical protein n=1 Tax=Paraburkholderia sp. Ac-20347 TaxID=2703892 RepID=UPI001981E38D|nr:hypothetical protein [Paraburkholderia sp. Ac-20347]MBN3808880.1 hypothetical protein [Paraburkholderia sp. Ac-20347]
MTAKSPTNVYLARQALAEREREDGELHRTIRELFEAWHVVAHADSTAKHANAVRRIMEQHLLSRCGESQVRAFKGDHLRGCVRNMFDVDKYATGLAFHSCTSTM